MIPRFTKVHNRFKFNGMYFAHKELKDVAYSFVKEGEDFEKSIGIFLLDWLDENDHVYVKTSGSTGRPKLVKIQKQAMVYSAIATSNYFNLQPGNSVLHCLPTTFIAGKMMLVRAMILGLELDIISPSSNPLERINKSYDFCAMVPLQLENAIGSLDKIKTLIVGGASVANELQGKLKGLNCKVYATYGMTETVTHIAVKQLNHFSNSSNKEDKIEGFKVLDDVTISQDERDCLIINAPKLNALPIVTNDVIRITSDSTFEIIGRADNVINSGGIKLFPEQIEAKLNPYISARFFIASQEDPQLGEQLIIVVEGSSNTFDSSIYKNLDTYEKPKHIYNVERFCETDSGKIQRKKTLALLK